MKIDLGKRDLKSLFWILRQKESYRAILNLFLKIERPFSILWNEILGRRFHSTVFVRTPLMRLKVFLFDRVDLSTLLGIFCREDYKLASTDKIIVDIGSNIGIASLYFLSRSNETYVYCFEPLPRNIEKLKQNLTPFSGRYNLDEVAISTQSGEFDFFFEKTGKFGGLNMNTAQQKISVQSKEINNILGQIIDKHSEIDCLKIDVEGLEDKILKHIDTNILNRIKKIYLENSGVMNLSPLFTRKWRYNVAQFIRHDCT